MHQRKHPCSSQWSGHARLINSPSKDEYLRLMKEYKRRISHPFVRARRQEKKACLQLRFIVFSLFRSCPSPRDRRQRSIQRSRNASDDELSTSCMQRTILLAKLSCCFWCPPCKDQNQTTDIPLSWIMYPLGSGLCWGEMKKVVLCGSVFLLKEGAEVKFAPLLPLPKRSGQDRSWETKGRYPWLIFGFCP